MTSNNWQNQQTMQNDSHSEVDKLLQAILSGNREQSLVIVKNYLTEFVTIPDLYENLLRKALYRVGEMWEYNKITVATEHLASAKIYRKKIRCISMKINSISDLIEDWPEEVRAVINNSNALFIALFNTEKELLFANQAIGKFFPNNSASNLINPGFVALLLKKKLTVKFLRGF